MLIGSLGQAQFYDPTLGRAFAWSYPDQLVWEFDVVRFEIRIDEGSPFPAGMSAVTGEAGSYSTSLPAMPTGRHELQVRACNSTTCGGWSEPLHFVFSPPFVVEIQRRFGWPSPYHQP